MGTQGGAKKSHKNKTKRIAMALLPRKSDAPKGKPRGKDSLFNTMHKYLKKESGVVADEWTATPPAVRASG